MRTDTPRRILSLVLIAGNILIWCIPGNILNLVAEERAVLLGRYSLEHLSTGLLVFTLSILITYVFWTRDPLKRKVRLFQIVTSLFGVVIGLILLNIVLLLAGEPTYYVHGNLVHIGNANTAGQFVLHRPPNQNFRVTFEDVPRPSLMGSSVPRGYEDVECILTFDAEGFRNKDVPDQVDVITLGDSFTEGSRVSDEQAWPVLFSKISGLSVRNLAVSGYAPVDYLAAFKEFGLKRNPKLVYCMLYESNDFRMPKPRGTKSRQRWYEPIKRTPVIRRIRSSIIQTFEPISAGNLLDGLETLSWLPAAFPSDGAVKHYWLDPKDFTNLYVTEEEFRNRKQWQAVKGILEDLNTVVIESGASLVVLYAPDKSHVVFPPIASELPAENIRDFCQLRSRDDLPPPNKFITEMLERINSKESVVRKWAQEQSIPFLALTAPLRQAAAEARQVYYTYDKHWTPSGQQVAADAVHKFWREEIEPHILTQ